MRRIAVGGGRPARLLAGLLACAAPLLACAGAAHAGPSPTLDAARARNALSCGVVVEQEDFTATDSHGDLSVFSGSVCRAVAAAALGDPDRARLIGFPDSPHAIAALRSGTIAVLVGATPTASSAMLDHLRFSPTLFVDGQGFLLPRAFHVQGLAGLKGHSVCFIGATPADVGLAEWRQRTRAAIVPDEYSETGEMEAALTTGHCDAITADISALANMRAGFHGRIADFEILPQRITYDPFAAATRDGDAAWSSIVADVATALIEAEQDGVTRANIMDATVHPDKFAMRLLEPTPGLVSLLGLQDGWAARAIAAGGNYGEILAATTGKRSPLDLPRGANALWDKGGLIAAPPIP